MILQSRGRKMAENSRDIKGKKIKLSPEEKKYNTAVQLMESMDCVIRFERIVLALRSAAKKFESLGDYKDAAVLKEKCLKQAQEALDKGTVEVYKKALVKQKEAKNKSDYADTIEDFKRVKKFGYSIEECQTHIEECKRGIDKLESIAIRKRRIIAIAIVAVIIAVFMQTPFYPWTKGMIHQSQGKYRLAIANYEEAGGILTGHGSIKECYYHIAEAQYQKGDYQKALKNYKKAEKKFDAEKKAFELEKKFITQAKPGDIVKFGQVDWVVLSRAEDDILMIRKKVGKNVAYDKKSGNIWYNSSLRQWLNEKYIKKFSEDEINVMKDQSFVKDQNHKGLKERLFVLDVVAYEKYKKIIPLTDKGYWLKNGSKQTDTVKGIDVKGNLCDIKSNDKDTCARAAVWLHLAD